MTIPELTTELIKANTLLAETQNELEQVLEQLPVAVSDEERAYNSAILQIIATSKAKGEKEPTEAVKKAMAESTVEMLTLARRVLEYKREGLKSRMDTIRTQISSLQTLGKLMQEEMEMERYKPRSVGAM